MSGKDKWVRRFSVDETAKHKNGFTIYKITSVLFPIQSPEALTVVSVWKRYSDVQRLHKSMRSLHAGLHLRGTFPSLPRYSFFKRFQQEVITERAKTIKSLLEFVAEHRLLFTSTDFVNFLQTGYPEPQPQAGGVINAIRSSLHLPIEETPPLEYQTDDDDTSTPTHTADTDPQRRALIKEKTNKYLSYAEQIYKNHLCDTEQTLLPERDEPLRPLHCPIPLSMLRRPYEELALYRVLDILGSSIMLVLHRTEQAYYAMKVIQKIPNNLTEFDEFFLQRTNETRQPVLPTVIPYMVPLQAYIETNNLIFLILSYAPGKKLFDYIKNYSKSLPTTPAREVNLENVFTEPKNKNFEKNDNNCDIEEAANNNKELSVNELVLNSQKLLSNVDKVLCESTAEVATSDGDCKVDNASDTTPSFKRSPCGGRELPASAVCRWAAEILTAIHCLHNAGVICRDLNPSNILLGDRGQVILTYFQYYPGPDMRVSVLRPGAAPRPHVAPELYANTLDETPDLDHVCDYWSFGAVLYELVCGVPLSHYHGSLFTSHTILQLPDGLPLETQSILTQLLTYEPSERLGAGKDGVEEIKRHPYFKHIDWQHVYDSWAAPD
ncbi:ribosomal protein S6 kinase delta-1 isoform X2 [Spodoptera frugiperda]|uniref:Ribosomal protein S6 kinase delta-1 isoform X2 n=1 Tax=Spodoptera frugiperda TaxID=7108 RepID=A0A9R0DVP3_SPOFR|nr:ribosomal protein S6 kinase delta-1 isoform X2 [Spodoptera frugiperda]